MPRKILIRTRNHVYHITSRSNAKEWFYIPIEECWKICLGLLEKGQNDFQIELHAFVLMSNHYHMLIKTPHCDIDKFMHFFNKTLSSRINMATGRINHVLGGSYKWSIIDNHSYYSNAIKYIYQNPVRASVSKNVESYPFSTVDKCRCKNIELKSYLDPLDLNWLNGIFSTSENERIKKGFKRAYFRPSYEPRTRKHKMIM
ncbi:MAG: hypothetical protein COW00_02100 [Bdellovibrio sp. CG12_big_fil_rev_8_21_14_0_65_39_13]|nr:MAG: hypothetical protein COW78_14360 [Bdellovibrio sp. CG22_combo_CG10-13_8_21_14_all_39_27]PIQ62174.1 MAG: hypothetical protein COW00_02100 [Bdellovibrio sp. CG12_big_fil_rev_8_21_14_0_65_39_13]PIR34185.1 MAG: hypothetical protein COV37_13850 [Bdellovibrio sp. CG11_big_fil_rev_8_21_14_0_20_39_38]PJB52685.1 MAG: hypothetical protein CO099_11305 [Bdellovibrio sp. CG_4_9_14_3_um_filter_39_7]